MRKLQSLGKLVTTSRKISREKKSGNDYFFPDGEINRAAENINRIKFFYSRLYGKLYFPLKNSLKICIYASN